MNQSLYYLTGQKESSTAQSPNETRFNEIAALKFKIKCLQTLNRTSVKDKSKARSTCANYLAPFPQDEDEEDENLEEDEFEPNLIEFKINEEIPMAMEIARLSLNENINSIYLKEASPSFISKDNSNHNFDEFTNVTTDFDILNSSSYSIAEKRGEKLITLIQNQTTDYAENSLNEFATNKNEHTNVIIEDYQKVRRRRSLRNQENILAIFQVDTTSKRPQYFFIHLSKIWILACLMCILCLIFCYNFIL